MISTSTEPVKIYINPIVQNKALFACRVVSINFHITPYFDGCAALPIPSKQQQKVNGIDQYDWPAIVKLVVQDINNEDGVTCNNTRDMTFSFSVVLQNDETARQSQIRVKKSFMKSWNSIVSNVSKGHSLSDYFRENPNNS